MNPNSQLSQIVNWVNDYLDEGRGFPSRKAIAEAFGKRPDHDFGGRVTFELQRIKIQRGIADQKTIDAFIEKERNGTYAKAAPLSEADEQRLVVEDLKHRNLWWRHTVQNA